MSLISIIGQAALVAALLASTATIVAALIAAKTNARRFAVAAEYGMFTVFALFAVASTAMIHGFIHQDLSLIYVYKYSDATMPWFYQLAAFWGGQAGSLMFWAGVLSIFSALAVFLHRDRDRVLMPWVITVLASVQWFFTMLLVVAANPFEHFALIPPPSDGAGLNPQLQTFTMVIHPPSLLTGYVACTIPFAFAMAALLSGRLDEQWLKSTRKWALIAWLFLAVGLLLGMLWAYTELGWGGYWAWDPVENAAFVPWVILTAFIHSAVIQERRGMLKRWNMLLVLGAWLATILGTYITRSGLIVSVHSFAQSNIGPYFKYFLLSAIGISFAAFASRWDALRSEHRIEHPLSREAAFLANNWILLGVAFVVLWGTLFPKIKEMFTGQPDVFGVAFLDQTMVWVALAFSLFCATATVVSWQKAPTLRWWLFVGAVSSAVASLYLGSNKLFEGPPVTIREGWFNSWMAPLGVLALLMVGVGTVIAWRKATLKNFQRSFLWPLVWSSVITVVVSSLYYVFRLRYLGAEPSPGGVAYAVLSLFAGSFVSIVTIGEFWNGTKARKKKMGVGWLTAFTGLVMRNQRRYGGYLVHLGLVFLFAGFLGAAFRIDARVTLSQGQTASLGDYQVEFLGLREDKDIEKMMVFARLRLFHDGQEIGILEPGRYVYHSHPNAPTTEVDVRMHPLEDVYMALSNVHSFEPGRQSVSLMMVIGPFVFWIWVGGLGMIFGTFIALWPQPDPVKLPSTSKDGRALLNALIVCLVLSLSLLAWPAKALPPSGSSQQEPQVDILPPIERELHSLIRCECKGCSGQSIANCHPGCGEGLRDRDRIKEMLAQGKSREQIMGVFVAERGEGVLMSPPSTGFNLLAWILPLTVFIASIPVVVWFIKRKQRAASPESPPPEAPSDRDQSRLERLERDLEAMD